MPLHSHFSPNESFTIYRPDFSLSSTFWVHHFLFSSTYSFTSICHTFLSLGKLHLFYVLDLPPSPFPPLCLPPSGSPLCCSLPCLFPHVLVFYPSVSFVSGEQLVLCCFFLSSLVFFYSTPTGSLSPFCSLRGWSVCLTAIHFSSSLFDNKA